MRQDDNTQPDTIDAEDNTEDTVATFVSDMTPRDFAQLGLNHIAYIRAVHLDDNGNETSDAKAPLGWSIHAANGERIGLAPGRDVAVAATLQHDMQPLSVH